MNRRDESGTERKNKLKRDPKRRSSKSKMNWRSSTNTECKKSAKKSVMLVLTI